MTSSSDKLKSLLILMRDKDPVVWKAIAKEILSLGEVAQDPLRRLADEDGDPLVRLRARSLLGASTEEVLNQELVRWAEGPDPDLEVGCFLLARWAYPDLDEGRYRGVLDVMAEDLRPILRPAKGVEALHLLNHYLFHEKGFRGDHQAYYDPENSFLNQVLDRRRGIPISLSALYLLIGQKRLGLPLRGVGSPGHFLLRYEEGTKPPIFIDAFAGGELLSRVDCEVLFDSLGFPFQEDFLAPVGHREILARMCRNLVAIYQEQGKEEKARRLFSWVEALVP